MPAHPHLPSIYVFFGLIATGKSTLAQAWAARHSLAYRNSDVVRKELAGLAPTANQREGVGQGIYTREFSRKTYDAMLTRAEEAIGQGRGVVLDASYQNREERTRVVAVAQRLHVAVHFVLCECGDDIKKSRLALRAQDPNAVSDGRWEIYLQQKTRFEAPTELGAGQLITLDTNLPLDAALDKLDRLLQREEKEKDKR